MKPKTRRQIAKELGISERTLQRWLKKSGLALPSGLVTPYYQKVIYELYWYPDESTRRLLSNINLNTETMALIQNHRIN